MANKIKILVESKDQCVNLPAIPLKVAYFAVKTRIWSMRFIPEQDRDPQLQQLAKHRDCLCAMLRTMIRDLKPMEPFRMIEVETETERVTIDLL